MVVTTRGHRRIRKIKAAMRAERRQPCMRCGQPIDYDAPPEHPDSFNAGHIKAWALFPELRADPGNFQQEHSSCGKSAGISDGTANDRIGMSSREW
jgi:hypothetical protein